MVYWRWIIFGVVIVGLFSGPSALETGAISQPPIEWSDMPFAFVSSFFGMLFVIGIQLFRKEPKYSKWAIYFMGLCSLYFVSSGLCAVFLVAYRAELSAYAFIFLTIGIGAFLGVWVSWLLYRKRFKKVL